MMNALPDVLLHFRANRVAFIMDIAAYFHQVLVDEKDADAFRYFWFKNEECLLMALERFLAHIFGAGSSSVVTSFVLRHHAESVKERFCREVYETIRHKFYVDDGAGGSDDVKTGKKIKSELTEAMALGGFELTKWKSNHPELMDEGEATDKLFGEHEEGTTKVLGVTWKPQLDVFTI